MSIVIYNLIGRTVPKARPRFNKGRAYMPPNYVTWKDDAIEQLSTQFNGDTIIKCNIHIEIHGKHRGDIDNIAGSILDALVQSNCILDDKLTVLSKLSIEYLHKLPTGVKIFIENLCPSIYIK